jgi:serine/threonine protein phosphatase PrpC
MDSPDPKNLESGDVDSTVSPDQPPGQGKSEAQPDMGAGVVPTGMETIRVEMDTPEDAQNLETIILEPEVGSPGIEAGVPVGETPTIPTESSGFETVILDSGVEVEQEAVEGPMTGLAEGDIAATIKLPGTVGAELTAEAHEAGAPAGIPLEEGVGESKAKVQRPFPSGHTLLGRYRVLSHEGGDEVQTIYEVEDLLQCWNCSHRHSGLGEIYCENCGAAMEGKLILSLRETLLGGSALEDEVPEGVIVDGEYGYQVVQDQETKSREMLPVLQLAAGFQSDVGEVREVDEDSLLVVQLNALSERQDIPGLHIFAVADGIGGHQAGEVASRMAVRSLAESLLWGVFTPELSGQSLSPEQIQAQLTGAVSAANMEILAAREEGDLDMGCTLTATVVRDEQALIVNVGDSRTYLMRSGKLTQITEDHSMVAQLLSQDQIKPEEVHTHDQKSVIYRSLGDKPQLEVDDAIFNLTLEPGDRLVLCCDGLWELVPDSFIEDVLLEYFNPQAACDRLVEMANQAGGEDNISVIVVNIQALKSFR